MVGESSKVSGRAGARGGSCEGDAPRGPGSRRSDCLVACAKGHDAGHPAERASGCPHDRIGGCPRLGSLKETGLQTHGRQALARVLAHRLVRDGAARRPAAARLASRSAASRRGSSSWSMGRLGPCSAAPSSGPMMTRPGGRSNRSVAPADSAGVACGAAAPRGPTRGSRGSRRIRRERCSEGASCCDADGCSRASVRAPQRRSRRALARRGRLGAPAARAGARGRAWARRISR